MRRFEPAVTRQDLADAGGAVAVYVSSANFTNLSPRTGSAPHLALTDLGARRQVVDTDVRIRRWWEMGEYVERWNDDPSEVPAYLIGVTAPTARRWVWGAIKLDSKGRGGLWITVDGRSTRSGLSASM